MRRVSDLVEQRPNEDPYEVIKARLLSALQLTDYQRADKLFELPGLGARKPSELMSQMLEICPRGEEKSNLFACLFLRRLPREIRVLLTKVDHKDPKALAEQADELWALHTHDSVVAAVQEFSMDEPAVNALKQQSRTGPAAATGRKSPGPRRRRSQTARVRPSQPGWSLASVTRTGCTGSQLLPVTSPTRGRETGKPGEIKCDFSRPSSSPPRSAVRPAFPGGHRCNVLSFSSPVFGSTFRTGPSLPGGRGRFLFPLMASILPGVSSWRPSSSRS